MDASTIQWLLEHGGSGGVVAIVAAVLIKKLWDRLSEGDEEKTRLNKVIGELQERRVKEAQEMTREVTTALLQNTDTLKDQGELIRHLFGKVAP